MSKGNILSNYNIATFTLLIMSVQFLYIEGWDVSTPKPNVQGWQLARLFRLD